MFVEFTGLADAVRRCAGPELDIIVLLRRADPQLERGVTASSFQLHCTPIVNLFHRRADRVPVSERTYEHHLVVDRVRPLDIEVYTVLDVVGEGDAGTQPVAFQPFYATAETGRTNARQPAYYTIRREKRLPSARRRLYGGRTSYLGSEVFLSVVDQDAVPISPNLRQFAVSCLCSNRDLPLLMPLGGDTSDFTLQIGAPVQSVRCLVGPTRPRPSSVHGDVAWKVISHLSLNYLSISDRQDRPDDGAHALREMLGLYADQTDASIARQVDGVRSVTSAPVVRRLPGGGQSAIARGLEITIILEEAAFEGHWHSPYRNRAEQLLRPTCQHKLIHGNRLARGWTRRGHAMADAGRPSRGGLMSAPPSASLLALLERVARAPHAFDYFHLLRTIDALAPERPRLGTSARPEQDLVRIGQSPTLNFAPATLAAAELGEGHRPARLRTYAFGMFGPNGPLPLPLTEYCVPPCGAFRRQNAG